MMLRLAFCHRGTTATVARLISSSSYVKQVPGSDCRCSQFISRSSLSKRHNDVITQGSAHYEARAGKFVHCQRRQSFTTITSSATSREFPTEYEDPAFTWAKQNPAVAQDCLEQPPLLVSIDEDLLLDELLANLLSSKQPQGWPRDSLERYCQSRHWNFPVSDDQRQLALALVSHVLSAPLSLAQFHIEILAKKRREALESASRGGEAEEKDSDDTGDDKPFRWCIIGARAESTLPMDFWKEYLWLVEQYSKQLNPQGKPYNQNIQMDFVGPDIVIPPSHPKAIVSWNESTLEICWRYEGLFHDMIESHQQREIPKVTEPDDTGGALYDNDCNYDAYVLFNPGLGHDNLIKDWKPTIEYILEQQERGPRQDRPVICLSAHSKLDARRDSQILNNLYDVDLDSASSEVDNGGCYPYKVNPFSSRITYRDPIQANKSRNTSGATEESDDHFVRPNHYVSTIW